MSFLHDIPASIVGGLIGGFIGTLVSLGWVRWRDESEWGTQEFPETLNLSLNLIDEGTGGARRLRIRTLFESRIQTAFESTAVQRRIVSAAKLTTRRDPVVRIDSDGTRITNELLNLISKTLHQGFIAQAIGAPARSKSFVFGLVYELASQTETKTKRIRCMLIEESLLTEDVLSSLTNFEQDTHSTRVDTLRKLMDARANQDKRQSAIVGTVTLASMDPTALPA